MVVVLGVAVALGAAVALRAAILLLVLRQNECKTIAAFVLLSTLHRFNPCSIRIAPRSSWNLYFHPNPFDSQRRFNSAAKG